MNQTSAYGPTCCIIYTTDQRYLFPTLVSAVQARKCASREIADVMILCFGLDRSAEAVFRPICRAERIILASYQSSSIDHHTAMMARLFLQTLVPANYTDWLYLDGDVHIRASLDPLLKADVPDGHFLAANDPITFLLADNTPQSRDLRDHVNSLGLSDEHARNYFNSGVLRIKRKGWDTVCRRALDHIQHASHLSRFPDQDALNVAAAQQRLPMSLAWNYPVFFRNSRVEAAIRPRIVHFMSSPKPWHGAFPPWTAAACEPYLDMLRHYPALERFTAGMAMHSRAAYHLQQRGKQITETVIWGWTRRRGRILDYERACLQQGAP